jgi:hypothetical protein
MVNDLAGRDLEHDWKLMAKTFGGKKYAGRPH